MAQSPCWILASRPRHTRECLRAEFGLAVMVNPRSLFLKTASGVAVFRGTPKTLAGLLYRLAAAAGSLIARRDVLDILKILVHSPHIPFSVVDDVFHRINCRQHGVIHVIISKEPVATDGLDIVETV